MGQRILDERLAAGMTQDQLAAVSNVPQRAISGIETGQVRSPGFVLIAKLARALNIPAEELVDEVAS